MGTSITSVLVTGDGSHDPIRGTPAHRRHRAWPSAAPRSVSRTPSRRRRSPGRGRSEGSSWHDLLGIAPWLQSGSGCLLADHLLGPPPKGRRGDRADLPGDLPALAQDEQGRDALYAQAFGDPRGLVDVDLDRLEAAGPPPSARPPPGATPRAGPPHGAHRSSSTGRVEAVTTWSKSPSPAVVSQGRAVWQLAQPGTPAAWGGR